MKVAIISGDGNLPILAAEALKEKGVETISIVFNENEVKARLEKIVSKVYLTGIAKVGKVLSIFKKEGITHLLMIGKMDKTVLDGGNLKPDLRALWILFRLKNRNNDTIHYAVVKEFESRGITIMSQSEVLAKIVPEVGVYSKSKPTKAMMKDIEFGYTVACELGRLDVGQTVVVKKLNVMAVESAEGTDKTIARGCTLAVEDAVVVKAAKPQQDDRFDLPVVGMASFKAVVENKGKVLAVEAGKTLVVGLQECIEFANNNDMIFLVFDPKDLYKPTLFEA